MKLVAAIISLLPWVNLGNAQAAVSFLEPNCGVSISGSRRWRTRVIDGGTADMFGNPWMVLIENSISCGGSLITNRFVLTAAHCIRNSPTVVFLGEFDRSTSPDCSRRGCLPRAIGIPVDAQIAHPRYVHHSRDDVALFRLARQVQYTDYIRPICLLTNYNPLAQIRTLTATGWGETEFGTESNVLKTTSLTQVDRRYCAALYGRVDTSHICAGDFASHVCRGDSGGPVSSTLRVNGQNRVIQLGIVSYGDMQCRQWSVFTNVMHHVNWIVDTVRRRQRPGHSNRLFW
ncbi:melanization protease 1-like isoform X2 [Drosophila biarmipes]|uniref:melanization protease 1-like isoform X2 n=1 Tax=Drosophila biarmipes TaxID=125945 RepID=UPI0007E6883C|nr:melanization protease 1-like isoform X2 [Drosophila biarmipes]